MRGFVRRCSHLARLFSVGQSVHGRDLWVLEISTKPGLEEAKPRAKYVANMHGDEPSGRCVGSRCAMRSDSCSSLLPSFHGTM